MIDVSGFCVWFLTICDYFKSPLIVTHRLSEVGFGETRMITNVPHMRVPIVIGIKNRILPLENGHVMIMHGSILYSNH